MREHEVGYVKGRKKMASIGGGERIRKKNISYELRKPNTENFAQCQSFAQGHESIKIMFSFYMVLNLIHFIQYFTLVNLQFFPVI